ncbi:efflux RND transporter periplasmic adaptor subunit [Rhodobacter calidifons]|uniref:Efflux RND transporter periplasmic adaptor subunit n=1 Tax=Rhodobacter calidifons TaxID=2715277 RepID=A0ABX0G8P7_9RHOB|nr:efflux RND transporter periplasmic adaptor subunit [Rhodobacter calidifons]NHB77648.1 efflux RND transporter periplasmic adaptor subunit [Rhodobacter calidifons]
MRPTLFLAAALTLASPALPALAEGAAAAEAASAPAAAQSLPAITVVEVAPRRLSDRIIASGLIAAVEEVQVAPLVEGQPLDRLLADVGDMVAEGQVLAVLSRTTLELQRSEVAASLAAARSAIAQAEAQLVEAETAAAEAGRAVERTARLRQSGTVPQATWDTVQANATAANARVTVARQGLEAARAQLALAQARLENVDLMLSRTEVKAPVAGKIVARNARIGAIATAAGQPMFVIVRDAALELRADVAETDIQRLAPGQKARLRAVGMAGTLEGTVRLVEPAIDPVTRLGRARIAVDPAGGPAGELRTGMFVEAEILAAEREALAVPVTAIGSSPEGSSVMRVRDGVVERVAVTTGIRDGGLVEITSGLAAGDRVVLKAGAFVRAGDRINPVLAPAPGN